jgi:hypothetical protein
VTECYECGEPGKVWPVYRDEHCGCGRNPNENRGKHGQDVCDWCGANLAIAEICAQCLGMPEWNDKH